MKYTFTIEIETNDTFIDNVNNALNWNRKYNPNRTFEDEAEGLLLTIIEDSIINDNECIDNVIAKMMQ